jgi:hypothetical protein
MRLIPLKTNEPIIEPIKAGVKISQGKRTYKYKLENAIRQAMGLLYIEFFYDSM